MSWVVGASVTVVASVTAGVVVAATACAAAPQQNTTVYEIKNTLRKPIYVKSMQLSTRSALFGHFRRLSAGAPVLMMRSYHTVPYLGLQWAQCESPN